MILNGYFQDLFIADLVGHILHAGRTLVSAITHIWFEHLKETPEILPNNSPEDSINKIFENVPVSLGKQHFSPKTGSSERKYIMSRHMSFT